MALDNHMITTVEHAQQMEQLQHENYLLRLENAHLKGHRQGPLARTDFDRPGPHQPQSVNLHQ